MVPTPSKEEQLARIYEAVRRLQDEVGGDVGPVFEALDLYVIDTGGIDTDELTRRIQQLMEESGT